MNEDVLYSLQNNCFVFVLVSSDGSDGICNRTTTKSYSIAKRLVAKGDFSSISNRMLTKKFSGALARFWIRIGPH